MRNADLIEKLSKFPDDAEIQVRVCQYGEYDFNDDFSFDYWSSFDNSQVWVKLG